MAPGTPSLWTTTSWAGDGTPDDITFTLEGATNSSEADSTSCVYNVTVEQAIGGGLTFRDGYVHDTEDDHVIGAGYFDEAGDRIDSNDAIFPGMANDEDYGRAGAGNNTVSTGAGDAETITDFSTATGQNIDDGNQANNDFVDLSDYYNPTNLIAYNLTNGTSHSNPLAWMRAGQADGMLQSANGLTIENGGSAVSGQDLTGDNTNVICFAADACISTALGEVAAGKLEVGELVETRDSGLQAIRWIGTRQLGAATLVANLILRPIRIYKEALGAGLPSAASQAAHTPSSATLTAPMVDGWLSGKLCHVDIVATRAGQQPRVLQDEICQEAA
ncbi:MAG: Hint domain-containing protein [Sedimentitalea sp.]|uniref:Hint domain-containing protein n=1 Tax=Sedimentitalea sp. TaxID=2048915 RepID=UPI003263EFFE